MGSSSELTIRLLDLMPRIVRVVRRQVHRHSRLTLPQYRILGQIQRGMGRVGLLADHHGVSQPAMSKMVESLVKRGWVKRGPSPKDRRQIELQLTQKGDSLFSSVKEDVNRAVNQHVQKISSKDQLLALEVLEKIAAAFSEPAEGKGRP